MGALTASIIRIGFLGIVDILLWSLVLGIGFWGTSYYNKEAPKESRLLIIPKP